MDAERPKLFGTDGVRGRANSELTSEVAYDLARAAGSTLDGHVVIGRDTRRSGPMLFSAVASGFNAVGVDVVDLGIVPVGAVSRLGRDTGASASVMISASHNPAEDNGIKFFGRDGAKLSDEAESSIEDRYYASHPHSRPIDEKVGMQTRMDDAIQRYVDRIAQTASYSMRGLEFAVDCAHGAAFLAAPALFKKVGASVEIVADSPSGMNINEGVGATHPDHVAKVADGRIGLAFDGDADRLIATDEDGEIVNGDVIMAIFAEFQHERGNLKNDVVVATVMSNFGFHHAMERLGIRVEVTPVGDRYVVDAMRRTQAVVGGEQSGHILLEDRTTGDGLRTALRLMEVIAASGKELRELRTVMEELPQVLTNVRVGTKDGWDTDPDIGRAIAVAESKLGSRGRVLVRPSGTEPLIRVMVEAPTAAEATEIADSIAGVVREELG